MISRVKSASDTSTFEIHDYEYDEYIYQFKLFDVYSIQPILNLSEEKGLISYEELHWWSTFQNVDEMFMCPRTLIAT